VPRLLELPAKHRRAVRDSLHAIAIYYRDSSVAEDPALRKRRVRPRPSKADVDRFVRNAEAAFTVATSYDETEEPELAVMSRDRGTWLLRKASDDHAPVNLAKRGASPGLKEDAATPMIVALAYSPRAVPKRWELVAELARDFTDDTAADREKLRKRVVAWVDRRTKQKTKALKWYEAHRELAFSHGSRCVLAGVE
jgi:hypothetical protein